MQPAARESGPARDDDARQRRRLARYIFVFAVLEAGLLAFVVYRVLAGRG